MKKHIQHAYCRILAYVSSIHLHQSSPAQTLGTLETWKCKMQQVNFSGIEQTPAAICTALISKATPQAHLLLPHLRTGASPPISLSLSRINMPSNTKRSRLDLSEILGEQKRIFTACLPHRHGAWKSGLASRRTVTPNELASSRSLLRAILWVIELIKLVTYTHDRCDW